MTDAAETTVMNPPVTVTIWDIHPSYAWLNYATPLSVRTLDGNSYTVALESENIPDDCEDYSDFELYFYEDISLSWITHTPTPGDTSFSFDMTDASVCPPETGWPGNKDESCPFEIPVGIRSVLSPTMILYDDGAWGGVANNLFTIDVAKC